jgi:glycine betaine/proline transport system substrate-binding protein
MIRRTFGKLAIAVSVAAMTLVGTARADAPESEDPIKLALHEWTGQHITSYVAGEILRTMGYNVEYVTAAYIPSATALADGNLTGSLEIWDNNLGEFFPSLLESGQIENIGETGLDAREGWLYPKHVEESCPGLPAWDAFLACSDQFATAETLPNGRFLEYPADWGTRATDMIVAQGLPFEAVPAGSEGALVAELNRSIQTKAALVMMFWAPHWVLSTTDTEWVDIPEDLVAEASMEKPNVFKAVWPGTAETWPTAYRFLQIFQITNDIQEPLMDLIDNQGQDALEVCKQWVEENEAYWRPMVEQAAGS